MKKALFAAILCIHTSVFALPADAPVSEDKATPVKKGDLVPADGVFLTVPQTQALLSKCAENKQKEADIQKAQDPQSIPVIVSVSVIGGFVIGVVVGALVYKQISK